VACESSFSRPLVIHPPKNEPERAPFPITGTFFSEAPPADSNPRWRPPNVPRLAPSCADFLISASMAFSVRTPSRASSPPYSPFVVFTRLCVQFRCLALTEVVYLRIPLYSSNLQIPSATFVPSMPDLGLSASSPLFFTFFEPRRGRTTLDPCRTVIHRDLLPFPIRTVVLVDLVLTVGFLFSRKQSYYIPRARRSPHPLCRSRMQPP